MKECKRAYKENKKINTNFPNANYKDEPQSKRMRPIPIKKK